MSSERPIHEILEPNYQDQNEAMDNQFAGMSEEAFSYEEYEAVRERLIEIIQKSLNEKDKEFLLSFKNVAPNWDIYDFERFPAVVWKLQNLKKLKESNPEKHSKQFDLLKQTLESF